MNMLDCIRRPKVLLRAKRIFSNNDALSNGSLLLVPALEWLEITSQINEVDRIWIEDGPKIPLLDNITDYFIDDPISVVLDVMCNSAVQVDIHGTIFIEEQKHCDLLFMNIASPELYKLHNSLSSIPNKKNKKKEYQPRIVIGKVNKGTGRIYEGKRVIPDSSLMVSKCIYKTGAGMKYTFNIPYKQRKNG